MFCVGCGVENPQQAKFCHKCGIALLKTAPLSPEELIRATASDNEVQPTGTSVANPIFPAISAGLIEEPTPGPRRPAIEASTAASASPIVSTPKSTRKGVWWPKIDTPEAAQSAAKEGAGICFWIAAGTSLLSVISILTGHSILGVTGWDLGVAAIFALAGWSMTQMSRIWSVVALLMYVGLKIVQFLNAIAQQPPELNDRGSTPGTLIWGFIFTIALVNGIRGTFAYHRLTAAGQGRAKPSMG